MDVVKGKLKSVVQHCVYEISTGKWKQGEKLPSVRKAEKEWSVNRLTVLSAYRELVEMGLVISEDRRGFFVASTRELEKNINQKEELDELYHRTLNLINKNTSFESSAVLKYFTSLAERKNFESPNLAFFECSLFQAEGHSQEILNKLNIPTVPILIENMEQLDDWPSIKTLLTTGFHIEEVQQIGKRFGLEVINVPIEVNPNLFHDISMKFSSATIFELEDSMSRDILNDVSSLADITLNEKVVKNINQEIEQFLISSTQEIALLSPRVWGRIDRKWQTDSRVYPIRFHIKKDSWRAIGEAARLPFQLT